jgi:hypothetical protein
LLIGEPVNFGVEAVELPLCVAIADQVMILRGFERLGEGDAACAVVQEWRCEVL